MLSEEKGSEGSGEGCEFVDEGEKEKGGKEGPGGGDGEVEKFEVRDIRVFSH